MAAWRGKSSGCASRGEVGGRSRVVGVGSRAPARTERGAESNDRMGTTAATVVSNRERRIGQGDRGKKERNKRDSQVNPTSQVCDPNFHVGKLNK